MHGINYLAIAVTAVAAIVLSSIWYTVFGKERTKLLGNDSEASAAMRKPQPIKLLGEFVRSYVVVYVLARLIAAIGIIDFRSAVELGIGLWIGFPFMILVGSVTWDKRPWRLAAIHAGDWLMKMIVIPIILCSWH